VCLRVVWRGLEFGRWGQGWGWVGSFGGGVCGGVRSDGRASGQACTTPRSSKVWEVASSRSFSSSMRIGVQASSACNVAFMKHVLPPLSSGCGEGTADAGGCGEGTADAGALRAQPSRVGVRALLVGACALSLPAASLLAPADGEGPAVAGGTASTGSAAGLARSALVVVAATRLGLASSHTTALSPSCTARSSAAQRSAPSSFALHSARSTAPQPERLLAVTPAGIWKPSCSSHAMSTPLTSAWCSSRRVTIEGEMDTMAISRGQLCLCS
jgi:hypothetical protein